MDDSPVSWRDFFDAHAPHYLSNSFTQWTKTEVRFLLDRFPIPKGGNVIDLGCGVGRHAVELAAEGYAVTGVDISEGMLAEARKLATDRGVSVTWEHASISDYKPEPQFDMALCLCEGGFGLISQGEDPVGHDIAILKTAFNALKPGGWFILTGLNGYATIRRMTDDHVKAGSFDPATMQSSYLDDWDLPEGKRTMRIHERLFIPPEVVAMLRFVGFQVRHVWGGTAGEWGERPIKLDEIEVMFVAQKPS